MTVSEKSTNSYLSPDEYIKMTPDDYDIEFKMSNGQGGRGNEVTATITNKTDYKWREVQVYISAIGKDGEVAEVVGEDDYRQSNGYLIGPMREEYLNPGESKDITVSYGDLDVDHFEVTYVIVQKEMGKSSEQ